MKIASLTVAYNEEQWIGPTLKGLEELDERVVLIAKYDWMDNYYPPDKTEEIALAYGATVIKKNRWHNQVLQRNTGLDYLQMYDFVMIVDADEVYTKEDIRKFKEYLAIEHPSLVYGPFWTMWKNTNQRIDAQEGLQKAIIAVRPYVDGRSVRFHHLREIDPGSLKVGNPGEDTIRCYHFSYVKSDDKIKQKLNSYSGEENITPNWFDTIWVRGNGGNMHPSGLNQWTKVTGAQLPPEILERIKI